MTNAFQFNQHFSPKSHLLLVNAFLFANMFLKFDRFELFTQVVGEEKDDGIFFEKKWSRSYISGKQVKITLENTSFG